MADRKTAPLTYYNLTYRCGECGTEWHRAHTIAEDANCACGAVDIEPSQVDQVTTQVGLGVSPVGAP